MNEGTMQPSPPEDESEQLQIMSAADFRSVFWRSFTIQGSWSFDKMMAYGFMYSIERPLRKIYQADDDYYAALKRHTETFNLTPHISPFVMTLVIAMEEEAAKNPSFDPSAINNIKVGLMGPLSGIGDSFFWGTFRVIAAGIGIGLASTGNLVGSMLYFLIYTGINFGSKIIAAKLGYRMGTSFLERSEETHLMEKLSQGASILGMMVIGAMIATMVTLSTKLTFTLGGAETKLQSIFDQIFPGLLPLAATFICVWLFNRNIRTIYIIMGIFVLSVLGCLAGVF